MAKKPKTAVPEVKRSSIQQVALERALNTLKAMKAQYVVSLEDGSMFVEGELQVTKAKKRRPSKYPPGVIAELTSPIKTLEVGQVAIIPVGEYDKNSVRSAATALAAKLWGNGAHASCLTDDAVEVMRIK